jgi:3-methylfumaryl-CoA hydratase
MAASNLSDLGPGPGEGPTESAELIDPAWQPVETVERDTVSTRSVLALQELLDDGLPAPVAGAALPLLWHWLAFLPRAAQHELAADGHPRRGGFLPPVRLPRRMIAGGRVELRGPIRAGEALVRRGLVTGVRTKTGRSGRFVLVTVRFEVAADSSNGPGEPLVVEEQDIVYREAAEKPRTTGAESGAVETPAGPDSEASREARAESSPVASTRERDGAGSSQWPWRWDLELTPTLLFRFSALTYNAHRIHYDRLWATEVEGYPGLVVHGPLQAIALVELCRQHRLENGLARLEFKATHPKFDDGPLLLRGSPAGAGAELAAFDAGGAVTMRASASFA